MDDEPKASNYLSLAAQIVSAYVGRNSVPAAALPHLIQTTHSTLAGLSASVEEAQKQEPAVPVKKSVYPAYIICLEDGKKLKMLKRHLQTVYGMTPEDYRTKWGLPPNYPMVAPEYADKRSALAKSIGLGQKRAVVATEPTAAVTVAAAAKKVGRPRKSAS